MRISRKTGIIYRNIITLHYYSLLLYTLSGEKLPFAHFGKLLQLGIPPPFPSPPPNHHHYRTENIPGSDSGDIQGEGSKLCDNRLSVICVVINCLYIVLHCLYIVLGNRYDPVGVPYPLEGAKMRLTCFRMV